MVSTLPTHASASGSKPFTTKYKREIFLFIVFMAIGAVTFTSLELKLSSAFNNYYTGGDSGGLRDLQAKFAEEYDTVMGNNTHAAARQTTTQLNQQPKRKKLSRHEDLKQLTRPEETMTCPGALKPVEFVSSPEADAAVGRKIPKIVHVTGPTKCLTQPFHDAMKLWKFENHSFYFHDDKAVDDLFNRDWPMFPQLKNSMLCLKGAGGGKWTICLNWHSFRELC